MTRDLSTEEFDELAIGLRDAAWRIAHSTEVNPVTLLLDSTARLLTVSGRFAGENAEQIAHAKDVYVQTVRAEAAKHGAVLAVQITEAWVSTQAAWDEHHKHTGHLGGGGREEILMVTVERLLAPTVMWIARIGVDDGEGLRRVGPWSKVDGMQVGGRMLPDVTMRGGVSA